MTKTQYCEKVSEYKSELYVIAYAILRNEADTEDAVCNAILRGYEHLDELKNQRKFKVWMCTITKNEALQVKRKRILLPGAEKIEELLEPVYDTHNELWDIIQTMKDEQRLVIVLFYYNHLTIKEISTVLNVSIGTVKSRLNRGREFLKKELEKTERGER